MAILHPFLDMQLESLSCGPKSKDIHLVKQKFVRKKMKKGKLIYILRNSFEVCYEKQKMMLITC